MWIILQNIIPSNEAQTKWGKKQKRRANNSESSIVGGFRFFFLWRIVADLWRIMADLIIIHVFVWRTNYYSCNQVIIIHAI